MLFPLSLYPASQFHYDPLPFSRRETRARNLIVIVPRLAAPSRAVRGARRLGFLKTNPAGVKGFATWLATLGLPYPLLNAWAATLTEFLGGMCFILGLGTRVVALALTINMAVAATKGHKGGGYLILNDPPGAEYAINLTIIYGMFVLIGPGALSLDYLLMRHLYG